MPPGAMPRVIGDLADVYAELPGVVGPSDVARVFAEGWCDRYGGSWRIEFRTRIHVSAVYTPPAHRVGLC